MGDDAAYTQTKQSALAGDALEWHQRVVGSGRAEIVMPRSRYGFDEAKIARFLKEGRGVGRGADYKPWLTIDDVSSRDRSHRFLGRVTGRIHHLLSDREFRTFLIYDWSRIVTDIREQFLLDREEARRIAAAMGVQHPADPQSGTIS